MKVWITVVLAFCAFGACPTRGEIRMDLTRGGNVAASILAGEMFTLSLALTATAESALGYSAFLEVIEPQ